MIPAIAFLLAAAVIAEIGWYWVAGALGVCAFFAYFFGIDGLASSPSLISHGAKQDVCPHADPFVYCPECKVSPCPLGLKKK